MRKMDEHACQCMEPMGEKALKLEKSASGFDAKPLKKSKSRQLSFQKVEGEERERIILFRLCHALLAKAGAVRDSLSSCR